MSYGREVVNKVELWTDLSALQVHIVITDLEVNANKVDKWDVVATDEHQGANSWKMAICTYTSTLVVAQAIINLIATRRRPPVSIVRRVKS